MDRRSLIRTAGLAGVASLLPWQKALSSVELKPGASLSDGAGGCVLIPQETEGPYPLDAVSNSALLRQDVREDRQGVQLNLKMRIIGLANCLGMQNVWVKIWHCDADGYYSGYVNQGYLGTQDNTGKTFLRGVQVTDAYGNVEFITIFPGWYTGRTTHIHFRIYISSVLTATSQLTFPVDTKNSIYTSDAHYSAHGTDPQTPATDNVFSDGYAYQMATLTPNAATGGWDSYLEVTVNGTGTAGLAALEPETGGMFKLGQNFPNPYTAETTVPFTLTDNADVNLELFDLTGKKVADIQKPGMAAGDGQITLNMASLGISDGNYLYRLTVKNAQGTYRQCKMMTALKK